LTYAYPLKHWATTLSIGPLLAIIYDSISNSGLITGGIQIYFLFVIYGVVFSLPVLLLYTLMFNWITKTNKSDIVIKTFLNVFTIGGVFLTFSLIGGSISMMASIAYSVAVLLASTFYKLRTVQG
jgi:hypothetical protein